MKKTRIKDKFLDTLKKVPIVQVSCEKVGVSRNSVYRWRNQDKKFAEEMDKAMIEGEEFINDISEGQLLNMIKEKSWPALSFWLRHRNPKFKEKVEITQIKTANELTPEQEKTIREALKFAGLIKEENDEQ
ncbi:MAG: hypothetical protein WCF94_02365 [bacterium]